MTKRDGGFSERIEKMEERLTKVLMGAQRDYVASIDSRHAITDARMHAGMSKIETGMSKLEKSLQDLENSLQDLSTLLSLPISRPLKMSLLLLLDESQHHGIPM